MCRENDSGQPLDSPLQEGVFAYTWFYICGAVQGPMCVNAWHMGKQWCTIHNSIQCTITPQIKHIQINKTGKMHLSIDVKFLKLKQKAFGPLSIVEIAK